MPTPCALAFGSRGALLSAVLIHQRSLQTDGLKTRTIQYGIRPEGFLRNGRILEHADLVIVCSGLTYCSTPELATGYYTSHFTEPTYSKLHEAVVPGSWFAVRKHLHVNLTSCLIVKG